jgi:hypothetical protein
MIQGGRGSNAFPSPNTFPCTRGRYFRFVTVANCSDFLALSRFKTAAHQRHTSFLPNSFKYLWNIYGYLAWMAS